MPKTVRPLDVNECPELTGESWSLHSCRRPIKRNGKCGIHAATDERVIRNGEKRRELADARRAMQAENEKRAAVASNLAQFLTDKFNLDGISSSGSKITLTADAALWLLGLSDYRR